MILTQTYLTNAQGYFSCQLAKLLEFYADRASVGNACENDILADLTYAAVLIDILCGININDACITDEGTCLIIDKLYELLKDCC